MTRNLSKMVNLKSLLNTLEQEKDKKRVSGSFNPEFLTCIRKWREELEKRMFPQARITAQDEKLPQSSSSLQPKVDGARTLSQLKKTSIHLIIRNINIFFSKVTFRESCWPLRNQNSVTEARPPSHPRLQERLGNAVGIFCFNLGTWLSQLGICQSRSSQEWDIWWCRNCKYPPRCFCVGIKCICRKHLVGGKGKSFSFSPPVFPPPRLRCTRQQSLDATIYFLSN